MAFIRTKLLRGVRYYAIVESRRDGGKVRQRVVASLGRSPDPLVAAAWYRRRAEHWGEYRTSERFRMKWARTWIRRFRKQRREAELEAACRGEWLPPIGAAGLRRAEIAIERDWEKEVEANQFKAAEYLRIAEAIERFAKECSDTTVSPIP
jgi:hypothetical protein